MFFGEVSIARIFSFLLFFFIFVVCFFIVIIYFFRMCVSQYMETDLDMAIALNFLCPSDTAFTIAVLSAHIVRP
jgi:hypothetical protein